MDGLCHGPGEGACITFGVNVVPAREKNSIGPMGSLGDELAFRLARQQPRHTARCGKRLRVIHREAQRIVGEFGASIVRAAGDENAGAVGGFVESLNRLIVDASCVVRRASWVGGWGSGVVRGV